jgi:hypothetical protein
VTSTCEHSFMAFQAMFISIILSNSRNYPGIVPVIESGKCVGYRLESDRILRSPSVHHEHPIQESARGGQSANLNSELSINSSVNAKKPAAIRSAKAYWMLPMKTAKGRARKKN